MKNEKIEKKESSKKGKYGILSISDKINKEQKRSNFVTFSLQTIEKSMVQAISLANGDYN